MKNALSIIVISVSMIFASCEKFEDNSVETKPVLEAYLYANTNVIEAKITEMASFEGESKEAPIKYAKISLVKDEIAYPLTHKENGYYYVDDANLIINKEDVFSIQMNYQGESIEGSTVVPSPPVGVRLSETSISISKINTYSELQQISDLVVDVEWDSESGAYYFITIQNISEQPESIFEYSGGGDLFNFSLMTSPQTSNYASFNITDINQFGTYEVRVYAVNPEYVDLYNSMAQDSRTLNEPLTNLTNAYGIFTAFNYAEVFFKIKKK